MSNASALVSQAKEWAGYYGKFANGPEGAVLTVPLRFRAAWDAGDAAAFGDVFADNGAMLVGDEQLNGPVAIQEYMTGAFAGPYAGTTLSEEPVEIRFLGPDTAFAVTVGGVLEPGQTELSDSAKVRTTWVATKVDGDWKLVNRQTSPVSG